jgi:hypothetical protein
LRREKKITNQTFTFLTNVDGISLCDKSKQSLWPVILVIIELPKEIRYCLQNVIIAGIISVILIKIIYLIFLIFEGLSVGTKPIFRYFLSPIIDELLVLEQGCIIKLNNEKKLLNFYVTHGVFDKPARAALLNIKSCTGFYGCLKCYQKGKSIKRKKGTFTIKILNSLLT